MGDANTAFFHASVNGRKRKMKICSLETDQGSISDQAKICQHIVAFYKSLFGSSKYRGVHLAEGFWIEQEKLDDVMREALQEPFSKKDVAVAINGMKIESAPCPNGFTVLFFKKLWHHLKGEIMGMVKDFNSACLDLKRLNFGVITLVSKVQEANTIKQFRPICLLNVEFKIFPKLLNDRLSTLADSIISRSQTAFIKSRDILEGVVVVHEVIHELNRSGRKGDRF
jgi:hypothetical protein